VAEALAAAPDCQTVRLPTTHQKPHHNPTSHLQTVTETASEEDAVYLVNSVLMTLEEGWDGSLANPRAWLHNSLQHELGIK